MKQTIRKGVFETNSSSIHTLTIFKDDDRDYIKLLEDFDSYHISIETGEYGWEWDTLNTPIEILSYLYTYACSLGKDNEYVIKLKEMLPNTNFIEPNYTSYSDTDRQYLEDGYIDHYEDFYNELDFIFNDKEELARCMFNGEIRTGNDNSYDTDSLFGNYYSSEVRNFIEKGN